jgi:NADPH:quinone reductase
MAKAVRFARTGGPEVLELVEVEVGEPGPGELRLRQDAAGLNFIDTYHRSGLYPLALPSGIGLEAGGVVEAVGHQVAGFAVGDRVTYVSRPPAAYADVRLVPAAHVVKLPDAIGTDTAAAMMLKGLTAWYLLRRSYRARSGDTVLLYAAAGGVGLIASQWARELGVRVIGVVSTGAKAELARTHGCAEIIMADEDVAARARALTDGEGVAAVYDSVGRDTFMASLDALRPHGVMVTYGNASGPVEPFSPLELASRGSLYVTRPVLFDFIATREGLLEGCAELFPLVEGGRVKIEIGRRYTLAEVAQAHRDLEARRTTGSTILIPQSAL